MGGNGIGDCTVQSPWVLKLSGSPLGPSSVDAFTGLVFSPEFPCGATMTDPGFASQVPLQVAAQKNVCLPGRKGELVLVRGTVLSLIAGHNPAVRPQMDSCTPNVASSAFPVKLAIRSCGSPEATIIDSDSELIVPAGEATIQALVPDGWIIGDGPNGESATRQSVLLRVQACPCDCGYTPEGRLTEAWTQDENFDPIVLVRPRRARRLLAFGATAGGAPAGVTLAYVGSQAGTPVYAAQTSGPVISATHDPYGSLPFLTAQIAGGAGVGHIALEWAIK